MGRFLGLHHPFFLPFWRRVVTVGGIGLWAGFEFWNGHNGWALLFGVIAAACVWEFFVVFDPENYRKKK